MKYKTRVTFLKWCAIITLVVIARCVCIYAVPDSWYMHEEVSPAAETYRDKVLRFEESARNLLAGKGYVIHCDYYREDVSYLHEYPPGFSFLLAAFYHFGITSRLFFQLLQIGFSIVTCVVLYRITCLAASPGAGAVAAVIFAVSPVMARYDVAIDPGVLAIMLISMMLYIVIVPRGNCALRFITAGLLAGLAGLLLPDFNGLPLFLLCAVAVAKGIRFILRYGLLFILFYILGICPLIAMNYRTFDRVMIMAPFIGTGLVRGLGQFGGEGELFMPEGRFDLLESEGFYEPGQDRWSAWEEIVLFYPGHFNKDKARRARALQFVREHPLFVLKGTLKKVPKMFGGNITGVTPDELDKAALKYEAEPAGSPLDGIAPRLNRTAASFFRRFAWLEWAAAVMALLGLFISTDRWRTALVIASIPVYLFIGHLPFFFEPRMMTPALPFIYVFTGIFLAAMIGGRALWGGRGSGRRDSSVIAKS